ncbi:golgin subfamily A member 6-like protein 4 [Sabethes cyaneus]|uniref:golgin subfamily A member 6-like protein 4 n=1 Tax=Sabethes cyaneus TaxID=53552 RepID=UPI00237EE936|nr:golgin subfamily A member 6-like protein 4 [Sabethes cyaneus]
MKLLCLSILAALAAITVAHPRPPGPDRMEHLLQLLPEDLRQELETTVQQAIANGERPNVPEELREQIREQVKVIKQEKLNRFLTALPEELRLQVEALVEEATATGQRPQVSDEIRQKIREHFKAQRYGSNPTMDDFFNRLPEKFDRMLSLLPEDLRQELQKLLEQAKINGERPRVPEVLRSKIREYFNSLKDTHRQHLDKFLSMLPEDLRREADTLFQQSVINGERPHVSENLRDRIREHFQELKQVNRERLNKILDVLPEDILKEIQALFEQARVNGERPHAPEELRNRILERFAHLNDNDRNQMKLFLSNLPAQLREQTERELLQNPVYPGQRPKLSEELITKLHDFFWQILPEDLRDRLTAVVKNIKETGELPELDEDLRNRLQKFLVLLKTPQPY